MKKVRVAGGSKLQSDIASLERLVSRQRYAEVTELARRQLRYLPEHGYLNKALIFGLIGQGYFDEAQVVLERVLCKAIADPDLHNNLGICYSQSGRWIEAIACFDKALELAPRDPELWKNKGAAFHYMYRWPQAIENLIKAIELFDGDYVDAVELLASALLNCGRSTEALTCYRELFKACPDNLAMVSAYLRACLLECNWKDIISLTNHLRNASENWQLPAAPPLFAASFPGLDMPAFSRITRVFAPTQVPGGYLNAEPLSAPRSPMTLSRTCRIGYFSSDFRDHPVAHIIASLIELHDRSKFEVYGYSLGEGDDSGVRARLIGAFDHFVDVGQLGVEAIARRIRADDIDILIDLQGWTTGARPEVLAMRPARFQCGWIGYPGSMGIQRISDFLIADAETIPEAHETFYTEKILRMPHCFLPMDPQVIPVRPMTRSELGLPESAFVFCSLNRSYKLNPELFDAWCRILNAIPDSVLWLAKPKGGAAENLAEEAAARGIDPARLIYAGRVDSRAQYLGNLAQADLALDTAPYNSHSTGMDTLWAGVPMVTLRGGMFAGRVGASLLKAAGLETCIADTWDDYCRIAVELRRDDSRRLGMRQHLLAGRRTLPLFDMVSFVRDFESNLLDAVAVALPATADPA